MKDGGGVGQIMAVTVISTLYSRNIFGIEPRGFWGRWDVWYEMKRGFKEETKDSK